MKSRATFEDCSAMFLKMFVLQKISTKSWSRKFCALFDTSPQGVRRLELFDNEEQFEKGTGGKILVLEDAVKVQTISRKDSAKDNNHAHHKDKDTTYNIFEITTEKRSVQLRAESPAELQDWMDRIRKVAFPDKNQNIMYHNNNSNVELSHNMSSHNNNSDNSKPNGYAVRENDLYGAVEDTFCVKLVSTPASEKCGLDPTELNYVIVLTADSMILKYGDLNNLYANDEKSDKAIFEWHYAYIRRYGIVSGFFSFEAGRKCPSGEGLFSFDAPDVRKIFECLASYMKLAGEKRRQMKAAEASILVTGTPSTGRLAIAATGPDDAKAHGKSRLKLQLSAGSLDKDKVSHDENCEGCRQMSSSSSGSSTHENDSITFGRACAVPQTPVSSIAVYANITDPDSTTSHSASMVKKQNGHGSVALLNSINGPTRGPSVEHIVVGDGVEYARVVKTHSGPPPPPPAQKVTQSIAITRMQSIETLEQGAC
ncbi:docking protein 1-like isoform X2 [Varroa jacobsoni]|uniref:docking protein 1-like isoform X2 n=1 Tax=Varroa jacobsoni TaxID=62625 RepID=UPI000BF2B694|nr:docking protein 1-like isoform X2 [Varroa jacobsoni]